MARFFAFRWQPDWMDSLGKLPSKPSVTILGVYLRYSCCWLLQVPATPLLARLRGLFGQHPSIKPISMLNL